MVITSIFLRFRQKVTISILLLVAACMTLLTYEYKNLNVERTNFCSLRDVMPKNQIRQPRNVNGSSLVLILTYMRSGSSYFGELFNQNPDSFYLFEPLYFVDSGSRVFTYSNGSRVQGPNLKISHLYGLDIVENLFTCNTHGVFSGVLNSPFMERSNKTKFFPKCGPSWNRKCHMLFQKICLKSSSRVIKTIRLNMADVYSLMERLPSLKTIHLLRDPRAIINSRSEVMISTKRPVVTFYDSTFLCRELETDLLMYKFIRAIYPSRTMQILYEDLVENPTEMVHKVYKFMNRQAPQKVFSWLLTKSSLGTLLDEKKPFRTTRPNSTATSLRWRSKIPWSVSQNIDKHCGLVYSHLGYMPFSTEEDLRNLKVRSRKKLL